MSAIRDPHDVLTQDASAEAAEQSKAAAFQRQQQIEDIKWLMAHASGRRFVSRLLEETGVHRTAFHTSGAVMSFNEGRKHLGYFLTGELLEITPEGYLKLLKEYGK